MFPFGSLNGLLAMYRFFIAKAKPIRRRAQLVCEALEPRAVPTMISVAPNADNTLYQSPTGSLSNGAGTHLYVGTTQQASNNIRRAAIKFSLGAIPAGSTINSASLTLRMGMTNNSVQNIQLHS